MRISVNELQRLAHSGPSPPCFNRASPVRRSAGKIASPDSDGHSLNGGTVTPSKHDHSRQTPACQLLDLKNRIYVF
jgi:hypothetical protein